MPLDDGRTPTNSELDKRLKLLEDSKISVKQLPMTELRKALAKEPQNPTDLLLPHSIGPELLKGGTSGFYRQAVSTYPAGSTLATSLSGLPGNVIEVPPGTYAVRGEGDFEAPATQFLVLGLNVAGGGNSTIGLLRGTLFFEWKVTTTAANTQIILMGAGTAGTAKAYGSILFVQEVEII